MVLNFVAISNNLFRPSRDLNLGFLKSEEPKQVQAGQGAAQNINDEGEEVISVVVGGVDSTKHEFQDLRSNFTIFYVTSWDASSFTVGTVGVDEDHLLDSVRVLLHRTFEPGTMRIGIYALDGNKPTGAELVGADKDISTITTDSGNPEWVEVDMGSSYTLTAATEYAIVLSTDGGGSTQNAKVHYKTGNPYAGGIRTQSLNSGTDWTEFSDDDLCFEIWGTPT